MLIAAFRGKADLAGRALEILDDPARTFASSPFVRLELLPKPHFHGHSREIQFYEAFFETASVWAEPSEKPVARAMTLAVEFGLSALDSLHVAAAAELGAVELITTEKPTKPIHRVRDLRIAGLS